MVARHLAASMTLTAETKRPSHRATLSIRRKNRPRAALGVI